MGNTRIVAACAAALLALAAPGAMGQEPRTHHRARRVVAPIPEVKPAPVVPPPVPVHQRLAPDAADSGLSHATWTCLFVILGVPALALLLFVAVRLNDRATARQIAAVAAERLALHERARAAARAAAQGFLSAESARSTFAQIALPPEGKRDALACGFRDAAQAAVADGVIDENEQAALSAFYDAFRAELDPAHPQVVDALVFITTAAGLRVLAQGRAPDFSASSEPPVGFVTRHNERFVWAHFGIGTTGVEGSGVVVFTTKALYFVQGVTSEHIPFDKIARVVPMPDALVLNTRWARKPLIAIVLLPAAAWVASQLAAHLPNATDY